MLRLASARAGAIVVAAMLVATACGGGGDRSGVNVKSVATDLTYGIPEPEKPASPANTNPVPSRPIGTVLEGGPDEGPIQLPPQGKFESCPKTPPTEFPAAAPSEIRNKPAPGTYRWPVKGEQEVTGFGKIQLPPQAQRFVKDVKITETGFTFIVQERELTFGSPYTVRTMYEVRTSVTGAEEAGLFLTRIERIHPSDSDANSEFNPSPPVKMLGTPVELGNDVSSVGVDPVSLEVLQQEGAVVRRARIDACGDPVDAFYVEAKQTFVSGSGEQSTRRFDYGIATIMGGLPVVEHIESPCVETDSGACAKDAVRFLMDAHIGQLKPSRE